MLVEPLKIAISVMPSFVVSITANSVVCMVLRTE